MRIMRRRKVEDWAFTLYLLALTMFLFVTRMQGKHSAPESLFALALGVLILVVWFARLTNRK